MFAIATTGSSFGTPGSTQVTDANGAGISGTFTTSSSSFPSGNGLAGSTFDFFFNVLPGDGNQEGTVNSADAAAPKAMLNDTTTAAGYSPYFDYYGAGTDQFQQCRDSRRGLEQNAVEYHRADSTFCLAAESTEYRGDGLHRPGTLRARDRQFDFAHPGSSQRRLASEPCRTSFRSARLAATIRDQPDRHVGHQDRAARVRPPRPAGRHGHHGYAAVDEALRTSTLPTLGLKQRRRISLRRVTFPAMRLAARLLFSARTCYRRTLCISRTSAGTLSTASCWKMRWRCLSTVVGRIARAAAISGVVLAVASRDKTSRSRGLN